MRRKSKYFPSALEAQIPQHYVSIRGLNSSCGVLAIRESIPLEGSIFISSRGGSGLFDVNSGQAAMSGGPGSLCTTLLRRDSDSARLVSFERPKNPRRTRVSSPILSVFSILRDDTAPSSPLFRRVGSYRVELPQTYVQDIVTVRESEETESWLVAAASGNSSSSIQNGIFLVELGEESGEVRSRHISGKGCQLTEVLCVDQETLWCGGFTLTKSDRYSDLRLLDLETLTIRDRLIALDSCDWVKDIIEIQDTNEICSSHGRVVVFWDKRTQQETRRFKPLGFVGCLKYEADLGRGALLLGHTDETNPRYGKDSCVSQYDIRNLSSKKLPQDQPPPQPIQTIRPYPNYYKGGCGPVYVLERCTRESPHTDDVFVSGIHAGSVACFHLDESSDVLWSHPFDSGTSAAISLNSSVGDVAELDVQEMGDRLQFVCSLVETCNVNFLKRSGCQGSAAFRMQAWRCLLLLF